jgi:hypothetical protein
VARVVDDELKGSVVIVVENPLDVELTRLEVLELSSGVEVGTAGEVVATAGGGGVVVGAGAGAAGGVDETATGAVSVVSL